MEATTAAHTGDNPMRHMPGPHLASSPLLHLTCSQRKCGCYLSGKVSVMPLLFHNLHETYELTAHGCLDPQIEEA